MDIASFFILIVFSIPIYGLLIWQYIEPEEIFLWGRRWMYEEEPEPSEELIEYYKKTAIIGIVFMTIVIIISFIKLLL
ncbi:hypothetical protein KQI88_00495 [Alkaliphilus sp. MSJ-5]|uniref:DUF6199 domain-containing protein n=1 Tax=Alkaliphilus flagellatus TaxID=2841507 RepID=A0ABS6FZS3_9FIRM|nr:hypothetical protein [Alkaliphilus flagellatus]MBU5674893.1 hypothetical protein [Alkaliphilus flagellatus]